MRGQAVAHRTKVRDEGAVPTGQAPGSGCDHANGPVKIEAQDVGPGPCLLLFDAAGFSSVVPTATRVSVGPRRRTAVPKLPRSSRGRPRAELNDP